MLVHGDHAVGRLRIDTGNVQIVGPMLRNIIGAAVRQNADRRAVLVVHAVLVDIDPVEGAEFGLDDRGVHIVRAALNDIAFIVRAGLCQAGIVGVAGSLLLDAGDLVVAELEDYGCIAVIRALLLNRRAVVAAGAETLEDF